MAFLKIVAVALLSTIYTTQASVLAPLPAVHAAPAIHYTRIAPPSVLPFSAQVSTFTRNLNVFDAPYAAGVYPGHPAIIQRALPYSPAHIHPAHVHPAPFAPASVYPSAFGAALAPRVLPAPAVHPAHVAGYPFPAGVVAPVGRSVHTVPALAPGFAHASLLG